MPDHDVNKAVRMSLADLLGEVGAVTFIRAIRKRRSYTEEVAIPIADFGSGGGSGSGYVFAQTSVSETVAPTANLYEQTTAGITTTLWADPTEGQIVVVKNNSGGLTTVDGNGADVEGEATISLADSESVSLVFNGTEWIVF